MNALGNSKILLHRQGANMGLEPKNILYMPYSTISKSVKNKKAL